MRRNGKTTRLIDQAIQHLFETGVLYVPRKGTILKTDFDRNCRVGQLIPFVDPDFTSHNGAQEDFRYRLLNRLGFEHKNCFKVDGEKIILTVVDSCFTRVTEAYLERIQRVIREYDAKKVEVGDILFIKNGKVYDNRNSQKESLGSLREEVSIAKFLETIRREDLILK